MPAPSVRYKILPARGAYAALNAAVADLAEGEICYATDQDRYYQKEGGVLVLTSMEEAPNDGTQYVRRNEAWEAVDVPPGTVVSNVAPVAPDNGQLWYDTEDARIFVWTGTEWADASPDAGNPTVITSDSAPGAPQDGDLWFRTSDGRMYVYYDDGASSQWVDANPATGASNWSYDGTTLTPGTAGTDVNLGTGDLIAAAGTFSGDVLAGTDSAVNSPGCKLDQTGAVFSLRSAGSTAPIFQGGVVGAGTNVQLNADGSASFAGGDIAFTSYGRVDFGGFTDTGRNRVSILDSANNGTGNRGRISLSANTGVGSGNNGIEFTIGTTLTGRVTYAGTANTGSDERLKTDLEPIVDGLEKIDTLRCVTGRYIYEQEDAARSSFLIAQDVQKVLPEAVSEEEGNLYLAYHALIPLMVSALQDAKDRIEALESANAALEARLSILEGN